MRRHLLPFAAFLAFASAPWIIAADAAKLARQCATDSECAAMHGGSGDPVPMPRLVAFGCDGAAGPLYAREESDLPRCDVVETF
jgi:hypothetical protein